MWERGRESEGGKECKRGIEGQCERGRELQSEIVREIKSE